MKPVSPRRLTARVKLLSGVALAGLIAVTAWSSVHWTTIHALRGSIREPFYRPRPRVDTSGIVAQKNLLPRWKPEASLAEIARIWDRPGLQVFKMLEQSLENPAVSGDERLQFLLQQPVQLLAEGQVQEAYALLTALRAQFERDDELGRTGLYAAIFLQGVTALRRGETENCVMCRGESSCILPISSAAVHLIPEGSRLAIVHFTEYLDQFPDDLEVRWLLNLAYMTLGEHPQNVEPRYLISLDRFANSEFDIGRFLDIGYAAGVNRLNQAGGSIMEDFDNDGLLDVVVTALDPTMHMDLYRNDGAGKFVNGTDTARLGDQLGGLNCVQTDYNNDGRMDIMVVRGAWLNSPIRPSLLRNNTDGSFTDVTADARIAAPLNSIAAVWADYDNDGWLDVFICCEMQPNRLYHNRRDGTFEELADRAGIVGHNQGRFGCKGAAWLDYDNDDYPDLFLNYLSDDGSKLFHNNRDGSFAEVTGQMNIDGPEWGFSCWAWDYDNDGWLDIFATCYDRTLGDVVKGLLGQPHGRNSNRLFRNLQGRGFKDRTSEAGLDLVFSTMGSNFGDFDNDGFLDMYLATGDPDLHMLVPNRMFKNVGGRRFAEITGSSGTGNLQKGHGVSCGDWDRDGDTDLFVSMGGTVNVDKYHNILFQNPGQGNHWLTVKPVGRKTNRAAIGARIKVVTTGKEPLTVYRHVSSGSSFGANALQQTIGLAKADTIAELEIHWPTSGTTQIFRNVGVDQAIEVTEFDEAFKKLDWPSISRGD